MNHNQFERDYSRDIGARILKYGNDGKNEASSRYQGNNYRIDQEILKNMFEFMFPKITKTHSEPG